MKYIRNIISGCLVGLLALAYACEEDFAEPDFGDREEYMLIYDYVKTREDLSVYKELCDYTGFYSYISTAGYYSVYAPTDSAWNAYFKRKGIADFREKPAEYWMQFMKYQAVEHKAKLNSNAYNSGPMDEPTLLDRNYFLTMDVTSYTAIRINNVAVIREYNINLQNGYLQITDAVVEPPIYSVQEILEEDGRFGIMLDLFERHGLKSWLTDSVVTLFIEPDHICQEHRGEIDAMSGREQLEWLEYHIFPGERYFSGSLDNEMLQPLLEDDLVTFNLKGQQYYWNQSCRISAEMDKNALNGVVHVMGEPVVRSPHTPGIVKFNLYGGTNPGKGYVQNVFGEFPAMVMENMDYASWHRRVRNVAKPPVCMFSPSQKNESFSLVIPDVLPASYTVRLVYRDETKPHVTAYYQSQNLGKVDLADQKAVRFPEYDRMRMHTWNTKIGVKEYGDVALKFQVEEFSLLFMERVDLIPDIKF